jgi:hypothetical protein
MPQLTGTILPEGAIVNVVVGLARSDIQSLRQNLRPIPQPVQLRALLDSGAQVTCLDPSIISGLALPWDQPTLANMPATVGMILTMFYRAGVVIQHPSGNPRQDHVTPELRICELPLSQLGYDAVIGRDILNRLRFTYDGPVGTFALDY